MSAKTSPRDNVDENIIEEFMAVALSISEMLKPEGKTVRPFLPGIPYFSKLTAEKKLNVLQQVRFYQELCQSHISEGYKISDNLSFTWRAFRKLGLTPSSDLFNYVEKEDIVEIYSKDQIQLFRNFNFFDCCSYTLEELHTLEWWTLFARDAQYNQMILDEALKAISGDVHDAFVPNVPWHPVRESRSADKLTMHMGIRRMAPVYKNKRVEGLIVLERATLNPQQ
ncbi:hypothetical protein ACES2L_05415 [Bdellovibrio bacteriovorus]